MRLFDKLCSQGPPPLREAMRKLPESFAVLRADSIANDYATSQKLWWSADDYPYFRLPWQQCLIEWQQPKVFLTETGNHETDGRSQFGVMAISIPDGSAQLAFDGLRSLCRADGESMRLTEDATCGMLLSFFSFSPPCGVTMPNIVMAVATTKEGLVRRRVITGEGCQSLIDRLGQPAVERHFDSQMHIAALACTFANCKNVSLKDVSETDQPAAKNMRRLKIPSVRRYTLRIDGKSSSRNTDQHDDPEGETAYHLCRGHFSTYTIERPLFGRLAGKFWIPPHTRGKKKLGEVLKDYETT